MWREASRMPRGSKGATKALRGIFTRKVFLGYNNTRFGWVYDCKYNPFTEEYYVTGFASNALFRINPQEGWSVERVTTPNTNEMLTIASAGEVWYTPTYVDTGLVGNPQVQKYDPDTGLISTYNVPGLVRGAGIDYDAIRDKILVCGSQLLVELNMDGTVNRTLVTTVASLEGVLIHRDLAYITTGGGYLVIVNLVTFTEIGATLLATILGTPYTVTLAGEKFSWHFYQNMPMLVMHAQLNMSAISLASTIIPLLATNGQSVREAAVVANGSSYIQRLPENLAAVGTGIFNYMTGDFKSIPYATAGVDWDGENIIYNHHTSSLIQPAISPYPLYFSAEKPDLTGRYRTLIPLLSNESIAGGGVATPAVWTQWCEQVTFSFNSRDDAGDFDIEYWDEQADVWRKYDEDIIVVAGTPNIYPAGGGEKMMRLWTNLDGVSNCDLQVHLR